MAAAATGIVDILHIQVEAALLPAVEEHNLSSFLELVRIRRLLSPAPYQPLPASSSWIVKRLFDFLSAIRRHLGLEELCVAISMATRNFLFMSSHMSPMLGQ